MFITCRAACGQEVCGRSLRTVCPLPAPSPMESSPHNTPHPERICREACGLSALLRPGRARPAQVRSLDLHYLSTMSSCSASSLSRLNAVAATRTGGAPHQPGSSQPADGTGAVVLDLFGTLVAAPDVTERAAAVVELSSALGVARETVDAALSRSWRVRHDGELRSGAAVAEYLVERCGASADRVASAASVLRRLAATRLGADESVCRALAELRRSGLRLALLSDASPDIAEAWNASDLASYFEVALFSCWEGAVKPAPSLFDRVLVRLGVAPGNTVYCGDGGGDELAGAQRSGMRPLRVTRRGGSHRLAYGETPWSGGSLPAVESLPAALAGGWAL